MDGDVMSDTITVEEIDRAVEEVGKLQEGVSPVVRIEVISLVSGETETWLVRKDGSRVLQMVTKRPISVLVYGEETEF